MKEKSDSDKIIWKCMMYKKIKCPSRMHTRGNDAIKQPNDHVNHAPDPAKAAVKTVVSEMKQRASTGQKTTPLHFCIHDESMTLNVPHAHFVSRGTIAHSYYEAGSSDARSFHICGLLTGTVL